jgi:hypothetical protein
MGRCDDDTIGAKFGKPNASKAKREQSHKQVEATGVEVVEVQK